MRYTVLWSRHAENRLAQVWDEARDRQRVTEAADRIDRELEVNAHEVGESRSTDRRICFADPLVVMFRVLAQDRKVLVLDLWRYPKRDR